MPKSKGSRKGRNRSRKLAGNPPAVARGFVRYPKSLPIEAPIFMCERDSIFNALDHSVVTAQIQFIDDSPTVRQSRKHIRSYKC